MAKYGQSNLKVEYDVVGGTLQDMSNYVLQTSGAKIEALFEQSDAFGDAWQEFFYTGVRKIGDITLEGEFDDTATTGPDVVFNDVGNALSNSATGGTRTLKFTWGGSKTTSFETWCMAYERLPQRGQLTHFRVTLRPSGAATEV